jgi:hypothetical protein
MKKLSMPGHRSAATKFRKTTAMAAAPPWNQIAPCRLSIDHKKTGVAMTFGYAQPFSFKIGAPSFKNGSPPAPTVSSVRHGVTEITLSDGRLVRATLHIKAVKIDPKKPGAVGVSYDVIAEMMPVPSVPICDVHETIQ